MVGCYEINGHRFLVIGDDLVEQIRTAWDAAKHYGVPDYMNNVKRIAYQILDRRNRCKGVLGIPYLVRHEGGFAQFSTSMEAARVHFGYKDQLRRDKSRRVK